MGIMQISAASPYNPQQLQAQKQAEEENRTPIEEIEAAAKEEAALQQTIEQLQEAAGGGSSSKKGGSSVLDTELTEEEEKIVEELKATDREVRQHEQAHKTVGGQYAGAIQYETTTGPDGREYAIGGEVPIDASPVPNNPEATIRKMDIVIRAALAPAQPSPQDTAVARAAQQARAQAQQELLRIQEEELNGGDDEKSVLENNASTNPNDLSADQQEQLASLIEGLNKAENTSKANPSNIFDSIN